MPSVKTYIDQRVPAQKSKRQSGQSTTMLLHCHPEFISGCCPVCSCFLLRSTISSAGFTAGIAILVQSFCHGWHCRSQLGMILCQLKAKGALSLARTFSLKLRAGTKPSVTVRNKLQKLRKRYMRAQTGLLEHCAP